MRKKENWKRILKKKFRIKIFRKKSVRHNKFKQIPKKKQIR